MIKGATKLPTHHISIRVPWHDGGWDGSLCRDPRANTHCTVLGRIREGKRDEQEAQIHGRKLAVLSPEDHPPCVGERASFMSPDELVLEKNHPYADWAKEYAHFRAGRLVVPPFSAACVPFRWMLRNQIVDEDGQLVGLGHDLKLGYQREREPEQKTVWVQERANQLVMLDTFFGAVKPQESLCFFYAKRTPLSESSRRVLVGVGRVLTVGAPVEYEYEDGAHGDRLRSVLWERTVTHSIRQGFVDGFLFPYHQLLEVAAADPELELEPFAAFVPDDAHEQFSYGSELVPHDKAVAALVACAATLRKLAERVPGDWSGPQAWVDRELNRLWKARGPFPGLGSALTAFGLEHGTLIGHAIGSAQESAKQEWREDPWRLVDDVFDDPSIIGDVGALIGATYAKKWKKLAKPRRALLQLLSRCAMSADQATRFWEDTTREKAGIRLTDDELVGNLYRAYEADRRSLDAVSFDVIDRALLPDDIIRTAFPVPAPSAPADAIDARRVRALVVDTLEGATEQGHTLLPRSWAVQRVRDRALSPPCPLDEDTFAVVEDTFAPLVINVDLDGGGRAFQLDRFAASRQIVANEVNKRVRGKRHASKHDWKSLLEADLGAVNGDPAEQAAERRARHEKAAALAELYESRASVLIGPAGTGKTTLLRILCALDDVRAGGILLLAPTGKARVRAETQAKLQGFGKTLAQFLLKQKRYDYKTGRYFVDGSAERSSAHKTVIIDECSMLTEEQLAATFDALDGVTRLILVGDPRQLPPIGAGRPFVDIVRQLEPANVDSLFPRVGKGYAALTVPRRQRKEGVAASDERDDILIAQTFAGHAPDPGQDEAWARARAGTSKGVTFIPWSQPEELVAELRKALMDRLSPLHSDPETAFELSLGGTVFNDSVFFWEKKKDSKGAAESTDAWQILSPLRGSLAGVEALNRDLQRRYRKRAREMATQGRYRKIPEPLGPEEILWGDKVINVQNHSRRGVYPEKPDAYVANGDLGIVVGQYKTKFVKFTPRDLEVELRAHLGHKFKYWRSEFGGDDGSPPLELAYALTVHKTQGSEFKTTYVVVPHPCSLLSREMLYTALTRHTDEVIVLHQGELGDLRGFAQESRSEISSRVTNLFAAPRPVEVTVGKSKRFLEEGLIHRTLGGILVRSKSEIIIADALHRAGVRFEYEAPLNLPGAGDRYPDFTIVDDASGVTYVWEHLGMMDDAGYRARWERKLAAYRAAGVLPHEEGGGELGTLIVTREEGGFDSREVERLITTVLK